MSKTNLGRAQMLAEIESFARRVKGMSGGVLPVHRNAGKLFIFIPGSRQEIISLIVARAAATRSNCPPTRNW